MPDMSLDTPPQPTRLADYRPPEFLVDTVELNFDLEPADTLVTTRLTLRRNPAGSGELRLDGEELQFVSIALDGRPLAETEYRFEPGSALIVPGTPDSFTLDIATRIAPERNTGLSGLYISGGNFCTQCEAEGFRRITYFPDRPDVMAHYSVTMRADKARFPVLLSNGNPTGSGDLPMGAIGRNGSIHIPNPPTCSRWWRATSLRSPTALRRGRDDRWLSASMSGAVTKTNAATRWSR